MVSGITVIDDFLSEEEEKELINFIDSNKWCGNGVSPNAQLKRRTQQYGPLFTYGDRKVNETVDEIPKELEYLFSRLLERGYMTTRPNSLIINEYQIGQGDSKIIILALFFLI